MRLLVLTYIPSPYQVELFDLIAARGIVTLRLAYLRHRAPDRQWHDPPIKHEHLYLDEESQAGSCIWQWIDAADLVVVSGYTSRWAQRVMRYVSQRGVPWCFWGERFGARQLGAWQLGFAGHYYRHWKLAVLHRSRAPIWGMGRWAVEGYKREFGLSRAYFNIPYFSNLTRFHRPREDNTVSHHTAAQAGCHFLFSGSLIERKGVDLLAEAFARLAAQRPEVKLTFVGSGHLEGSLRQRLSLYRSRVAFQGFRQWDELPQQYWGGDVLCVPSRHDGWGIVVPEGLAAGLPVIASDGVGAAADLVQPGNNGWVVRADDAESLYQAMRDAAGMSTVQLAQMSCRAQESVAEHSLTKGAARFEIATRESLAPTTF